MVFLKFQVVRKGLSDEVTFELRPERCVKWKVADCNKCTLWCRVLIVGETPYMWGQAGIREISVFCTQFGCECETALKSFFFKSGKNSPRQKNQQVLSTKPLRF